MMCGRYELDATRKDLWERYQVTESKDDFTAREEIFPTNICPVVIPGQRIVQLKWGFTETFAKRPLINARQETILQKPTFRESFTSARCLVPATAFFEWEKKDDTKIKRRISIKGLLIFSLAGIRKSYPQSDGSVLETFSILTTDATPSFSKIHDRMPVILKPENEALYLNHDVPSSEVKSLLTTESQLKLEVIID